MERMTADEVARKVEQQLNAATYCEAEGPDTRVDIVDGTSVWFRSRPDGLVEVEGHVAKSMKMKVRKIVCGIAELEGQWVDSMIAA